MSSFGISDEGDQPLQLSSTPGLVLHRSKTPSGNPAGASSAPSDLPSRAQRPLSVPETANKPQTTSIGGSMRHSRTQSSRIAYDAWKESPSPETGAVLLEELSPFIKAAVQRHTGDTGAVNIGRAKVLLID